MTSTERSEHALAEREARESVAARPPTASRTEEALKRYLGAEAYHERTATSETHEPDSADRPGATKN